MSPTVTLDLETFDNQRKLHQDTIDQVKILEKKLQDALMTSDQSGRIGPLNTAARTAIEIIGFAMGNLSPEIIKRWPYEALRRFADQIPALIDSTPHDIETQAEYRKFANECETWEKKRAAVAEQYIPPPPGSVGSSLG